MEKQKLEIKVFSKKAFLDEIKKFPENMIDSLDKYGFICINQPESEEGSVFRNNHWNVLNIEFYDYTDQTMPKGFTSEIAYMIDDFIKNRLFGELPVMNKLFIHCEAGISRSYTIAECLHEYLMFNLSDKINSTFLDYKNPQKFINYLIKDELGKVWKLNNFIKKEDFNNLIFL